MSARAVWRAASFLAFLLATVAAAPSTTLGMRMVPPAVTLLDGKPARPEHPPFVHGEELTYDVSWMGIPVGTLVTRVDGKGIFRGRPAIHITGSASSNKAFSLFFSIADAGESWVDPEGLFSLGFVSDQKEGSIKDRQEWVLDNERAVAIRERVWKNGASKEDKTHEEVPLTRVKLQDAASMFYYYRAFPLKPGNLLSTPVFVDKKIWQLTIEVAKEEDTVQTPAGSFRCLRIHPKVELNGVEQKRGELTLWVTEDERKIPVKMESELPLGKIHAVLTRFHEGE